MIENKRAARLRSIRFLALLLATVVAVLGTTPMSMDLLPIASLLCLPAPPLVVASAIVVLRKIAAGSYAAGRGLRSVVNGSIVSLAVLPGGVDLVVETLSYFSTPACKGLAADYCAFGVGFTFLGAEAVILGISGVAGIVAVVAGLSSAAKSGKRGWFVAILLYLVGTLILVVVFAPALSPYYGESGWFGVYLDAILPTSYLLSLLCLLPFLTPIITLIYGLTSRETGKAPDTQLISNP
jgi:hypothetical protein